METVLLAAWAAAAVLLVLLAIAEMTKHRRLEREKRRHLYGGWWQRRSRVRPARMSASGRRAAGVAVAQVRTPARGTAVPEQPPAAAPATSPRSQSQSGAVSLAPLIEATPRSPTPVTEGDASPPRRSFSDDDVASKRSDDATPGASPDQPLLVGVGLAASVLAGWFLVRKRR